MSPPIKVAVIDDDASMRKALVRLIKSAGIEDAAFSSAREFLDDPVHAGSVEDREGLAVVPEALAPRSLS